MKTDFFTETINVHSFRMNYIPEGTFDMGDEHGDLWEACRPVQKGINIQPFYMAEYPVTQALWKTVMGTDNNPSRLVLDQQWLRLSCCFQPLVRFLRPKLRLHRVSFGPVLILLHNDSCAFTLKYP